MDSHNGFSSWQEAIATEWSSRRAVDQQQPSALFPLAMNPFGQDEIIAMTEVLLSGRLTLDQQVDKAEKKFASMLKVPYAVMVNSGSSANLLAVSVMANKLREHHCCPGDHVLVPAVCWSTSVFPLLQNGLYPVFVDTSPRTFNVTIEELEHKLTPRVKAVMAVHVLGNAIDMRQLMKFIKQHNLILIEDTCESLGSFCLSSCGDEYDATQPTRQMLGTFGDFGTFSFYFSHHITSGEGGMITCKTEEDYNLLRCLRAHGWTRHLTNRHHVEQRYPQFDSRFLFVNIGYNLRPLEVQGAMINVQLEKLEQFNECRRDNLRRIRDVLLKNQEISSKMSLMEPSVGVDPAWFGVAALLHRPYAHQRSEFLEYLEKNGIENRPIISGNFIRQPCIAAFCENERPEDYPGAEAIHVRGFFIGVHQIAIEQQVIEQLVRIILGFSFHPQHVILVTGHGAILRRYIQDHLRHEGDLVLTYTSSVKTKDAEWIFLDPRDSDLCLVEDVKNIFKRFQPTRILHCASHELSPPEISSRPADYWLHHVTVNNNILKTAFEFQTWVGPIKVLSLLSAGVFSPISEAADISINPYKDAQKALLHLTRWYRKQYGCSFTTIIADDTFGPYHTNYGQNFLISNSSINTLIMSICQQKENEPLSPITLPGTEKQVYNALYARDLIEIIISAMFNFDDGDALLVRGSPVPIVDLAQSISNKLGFTAGFIFDNDPSKDSASNDSNVPPYVKLINPPVIPRTSLLAAIQETVRNITEVPVHN